MSSYCGLGPAPPETASLSWVLLASEMSLGIAVLLFRTGVENVCGPKDSISECPVLVE